MRPSSLLGVLLDLLDELEAAGPHPADVRMAKFFRRRRYLGSRDRRFIGDGAYAWIRHRLRGETRWWHWFSRQGLAVPVTGRVRHLGPLLALAADRLFPWEALELGEAARTFAAAAGGWVEILDRIQGGRFLEETDWPPDPVDRAAAELSLPRWLLERLTAARGPEEARALGLALLEPAPVDLRVNLTRVEREVVRRELEEAHGVEVEATPLSPAGLRLRSRLNLQQFLARHPGWAEIQDEGSQLAAMATAPQAGESIIDACAGGGGKLLAMADLSGGDATYHACDIDASRLAELLRRAEPLGLRSLTVHPISPTGALPMKLPGKADLVLVDAPCSGFGSLRRNPDLKTRHDEEAIREFALTQREILDRFAGCVRPGGRLVYVTCSILPDENETVVESFLEEHPTFAPELPPTAGRLPPRAVVDPWLQLDPVTTGTDGFFVALLRRKN